MPGIFNQKCLIFFWQLLKQPDGMCAVLIFCPIGAFMVNIHIISISKTK